MEYPKNHDMPDGTLVEVDMGDGRPIKSRSRCVPWQNKDFKWLVLVKGISGGGVDLSKVKPVK